MQIRTWQHLGSGIHASVWRARKRHPATSVPCSPGGRLDAVPIDPLDDIINWVAVKVVYDNKNMPPHDIEREAAILKRISHPNVTYFTLCLCVIAHFQDHFLFGIRT